MKTPISVKPLDCKDRIAYIQNQFSSNEDILVANIKNNFYDNLSYQKVYLNKKYDKSYDSWIYNGNKPENIVGWKYFLSYPYDNIQFEIGDVVYWKYKDKDDNYYAWLITSLDVQHFYDVKGKIFLCNNNLKQYNNGMLNWEEPCVYENVFTGTDIQDTSKGLPLISGQIRVLVQNNNNTSQINFNDRFIFDGSTFQVTQINNHIAPKILELYMKFIPSLESELKEQNVLNGIYVTPNNFVINNGQSNTYNVENYIDGVLTDDTFRIVASGASPSSYEILVDSPFDINSTNQFVVTNIERSLQPLQIDCIDNTTNESKTIYITLGGDW